MSRARVVVIRAMSKRVSKILLVEDSPTARTLVRVFLMGLANPIVEAESAEDAMTALDDADIEVVITDNQLPGVQGVDFVKRLRSDPRGHVAHIGIVMLSGQDVQTDAASAGVDYFIRKPVKDATLREAVVKLIAAGRRSPGDAPAAPAPATGVGSGVHKPR